MKRKILNDKDLDLVKRYFLLDLDEKELEEFESRLENNNNFREEVERYQKVDNFVNQIEFHPYSNEEIPLIDEKNDNPPIKSNVKSKNWLKILAFIISLVCVALLISYLMRPDNTEKIEKVYADCSKYTYRMTSDVLRSDEGTAQILSPEEKTAFDNAIQFFEKDSLNKAESIFNDIITNSNDFSTQELAYWWLVNVYLKNNDRENAISTLKKIIANDEFNSQTKAKSLLNQL